MPNVSSLRNHIALGESNSGLAIMKSCFHFNTRFCAHDSKQEWQRTALEKMIARKVIYMQNDADKHTGALHYWQLSKISPIFYLKERFSILTGFAELP